MELLSRTKCYGGWLQRYRHNSSAVNGEMVFAIYLPQKSEIQPVPTLYWLSGLTCTDENFCQKAGAFRVAADLGLAIVCPDTSPRGSDYPREHDSYDFGSGAGFYVNATIEPYSKTYRMYDYVVNELPQLVESQFPLTDQRAISGHSMGGHGALICALKNPGRYQSVSAFSPVVNPSKCPWGQKAFQGYLGDDVQTWAEWDACSLIPQARERLEILVDQGEADDFLEEQLRPETLEKVCAEAQHPLTLRRHKGYDHSYFFITSFIEDHLRHHGKALGLL
ncbi:MAG: S-formylglutathione hydrolase [Desulforhopalus sp.]|jgi:S-formylglutathione hydrolase